MNLIKVVFAPMDNSMPCIRYVENSTDALEEIVGGPAYFDRISDKYIAVINPRGEEMGFQRNRFMAKRRYYGNFVVVKTDPNTREYLDVDDGEFAMFFVAMMCAAEEVGEAREKH